ncbi:UNVERIFIED_CONTAM: Cysteine-rich protein 2-binding protein [Trichonephila clavipes]
MEGKSTLHCYCFTFELEDDMLTCTECNKRFHQSCLRTGHPSPLTGDIYFDFTCQNCSLTGMEIIKRKKLQWALVIMIALYNLQLQGDGKYGFVRLREHICPFIDKYWVVLFGAERKRSASWYCTVAGTLSTGANRFFLSGFKVLGENGWWSLKQSKLPSLDELDSIALNFRTSRKDQIPLEAEISPVEGSRKKNPNFAEAAGALKEKKACVASNSRYPKPKKKRLKSKEKATELSNLSFPYELNFTVSQADVSNSGYLQDNYPTYDLDIQMKEPPESLNLNNQGVINALDEPNYLEDFTYIPSMSDTTFADMNEKKEYKSEEEDNKFCKTVCTDNKFHSDTGHKLKVMTKDESSTKEQAVPDKNNFRLMTPYEEKALLEKVQNYTTVMEKNPVLRRLYRKLKVRELKRERNLPVFDIDAQVRQLKGIDPPDCMMLEKPFKEVEAVPVPKFENILDRFRIGNANAHEKSQQHISFRAHLMGMRDEEITSFKSPYTERILKPFIFRDYDIKTLKMRLLEEILHYTNKNDPNWISPRQSPIDYCYVRPQHIPAINALCHKFFWPGIDMSECLEYPDFSCVVLYKKLIIGFAFMLPDVKYNEAYISFIFCHPEWRQSGIGSCMLYHLIQTCMGKDVTLHVSASNAALFLYEGIGFEVEELIYDFYDKYLPPDSKECRHALLLRFSR